MQNIENTIELKLKKSIDINKYDIVIIKQFYKNKQSFCLIEEFIIRKVKEQEGLDKFINILNKIFIIIDEISPKNLADIKHYIKNMIKNVLSEEEVNLQLKSIDKFVRDKYDLEAIKECSSLFELIYNNKAKIREMQFIHFIVSINYILEELQNRFICKDEIIFFTDKLYEILVGYIPNNNNIIQNGIVKGKKDKKKESKFSSHSEKCLNKSLKMEQKVKLLNSTIDLMRSQQTEQDNNNINNNNDRVQEEDNPSNYGKNNEDKQKIDICCIDEKENKEYHIKVDLGKNEKFDKAIDYFFEKNPKLVNGKIKAYINDGRIIKVNEYIKKYK